MPGTGGILCLAGVRGYRRSERRFALHRRTALRGAVQRTAQLTRAALNPVEAVDEEIARLQNRVRDSTGLDWKRVEVAEEDDVGRRRTKSVNQLARLRRIHDDN